MTLDVLIGSATRNAEIGRTFERKNPFGGWSATAPAERRALLMAAADIRVSKSDEFATAMTRETGATGPWGGFTPIQGPD